MSEAAKSHVISGCYERFVLGHEARQETGGVEKEKEKEEENPMKWSQRFAVKAHQGPVKCVKAKGGLIVSGGDDDCVRIYDLINGKDLGTLVQHEGSVSCLDMFQPEGAERPSHLFSGGVDGLINVWRVKDFKVMSKLRGHKRGVKSLAVHSSGKLALSCDQDKNMCMWNLIKGRVTYKSKLDTVVEELVLSQIDNKYVGRTRNNILVRDLENPDVHSTLEMNGGKSVVSLCYPGTNYVMSGSADGTVNLWDMRSSKKTHEFKAHKMRVKGLAVPYNLAGNHNLQGGGSGGSHPNYFVSASSDGDLKLWDTRKIGGDGAAEKEVEAEPLAVTQMRVRLTCLCAKVGSDERAAGERKTQEEQRETKPQVGNGGRAKENNAAAAAAAVKKQKKKVPVMVAEEEVEEEEEESGTPQAAKTQSTFAVKPVKKNMKNRTYKQKNKALQQKLKRLRDKDQASEFD